MGRATGWEVRPRHPRVRKGYGPVLPARQESTPRPPNTNKTCKSGASAERWYHHPASSPDFSHDPNRFAGRSRRLLTAFSGCFAWCLGCSLSRQHVLSDFHLACADRELLYMDRADNHYHHHESLLPPIVNVKDYPKVPQNAYTFQPLHPPQGSLASPASAKYAVGSRDKLQSAVSFNPN